MLRPCLMSKHLRFTDESSVAHHSTSWRGEQWSGAKIRPFEEVKKREWRQSKWFMNQFFFSSFVVSQRKWNLFMSSHKDEKSSYRPIVHHRLTCIHYHDPYTTNNESIHRTNWIIFGWLHCKTGFKTGCNHQSPDRRKYFWEVMTWGGVAKPPVMPRGVGAGPHPWDCLRGTLIARLFRIFVGSCKVSYLSRRIFRA